MPISNKRASNSARDVFDKLMIAISWFGLAIVCMGAISLPMLVAFFPNYSNSTSVAILGAIIGGGATLEVLAASVLSSGIRYRRLSNFTDNGPLNQSEQPRQSSTLTDRSTAPSSDIENQITSQGQPQSQVESTPLLGGLQPTRATLFVCNNDLPMLRPPATLSILPASLFNNFVTPPSYQANQAPNTLLVPVSLPPPPAYTG
jgi:hypothetical protein